MANTMNNATANANNNNANNAQAGKTFVEMMEDVAQEISRNHADDISKVKEEAKKASAVIAGAFTEAAEKVGELTGATEVKQIALDAWHDIEGNGVSGIHDAAERIRGEIDKYVQRTPAWMLTEEKYEKIKDSLNTLEKVEAKAGILVRKVAGKLKGWFGVNVKIDIEGTVLQKIADFIGKIKECVLKGAKVALDTIKVVLCHIAAGTIAVVGFIVRELKALFNAVSSFIGEHLHKYEGDEDWDEDDDEEEWEFYD